MGSEGDCEEEDLLLEDAALKVWNKRAPHPFNAVYIGRPSKWGNPWEIGVHGTRAHVIALYRDYILNRPKLLAAVKKELVGKDLLCFCSPNSCHGDFLLQLANEVVE